MVLYLPYLMRGIVSTVGEVSNRLTSCGILRDIWSAELQIGSPVAAMGFDRFQRGFVDGLSAIRKHGLLFVGKCEVLVLFYEVWYFI